MLVNNAGKYSESVQNPAREEGILLSRIAIVFTSRYGQTAKISDRICQDLEQAGHTVRTFQFNSELDFPSLDLDNFDVVILGSPISNGKFLFPIVEWTRLYLRPLRIRETMFFSVSLNAADKRPTARVDDKRSIEEFTALTGLKPALTASLAGCVNYTKSGWVHRMKLLRFCNGAGLPTDTTQDHALTDWEL